MDSQASALERQNGDLQGFQDTHARHIRIAKPDSRREISTRNFDSRALYIAYVASDSMAAETKSYGF